MKRFLRHGYKSVIIIWTLLVGVLVAITTRALSLAITYQDAIHAAHYHHLVSLTGWATVILVVLIELGVRVKGGSKRDRTFWIHTFFVLLYAVTLSILVIREHVLLTSSVSIAWTCFVSYIILACIGIPMVIERF